MALSVLAYNLTRVIGHEHRRDQAADRGDRGLSPRHPGSRFDISPQGCFYTAKTHFRHAEHAQGRLQSVSEDWTQTATPTRAVQLEQKGRNVSICACSMPREIVTQQQGGTITVHSEVGEFGEFKVRPAGGDRKAAIGPSSLRGAQQSGHLENKAGIEWRAITASWVANDPYQTSFESGFADRIESLLHASWSNDQGKIQSRRLLS
jgi:hypothetical protein